MPNRACSLVLVMLLAIAPAVAARDDWAQRMVGVAGSDLDGSGLVAAVLDSGLDHNHPALRGKFWQNPADPPNGLDDDLNGLTDDVDGWDYCHDAPPRATPGFGHGTFVAGILAGSGDGGARGVAPGLKLMDIQVYCDDDQFPANNGPLDRDSLRQGLRYAVDHGADLIVLSLQGWQDQGSEPVAGLLDMAQSAQEEFQRAHDAGILVIGAAGNEGSLGPSQPGAETGVLTIGATSGCGYRESFSNWGPDVDLWAPDRQVGPKLGGGYKWDWGTSFATPLVAGAAALLKQKEPDLTPDALATRLEGAAAPSHDGPVLDVHSLLGTQREAGMATLELLTPQEVGGPSYVQYAAHGSTPDLIHLRIEGVNEWCVNLADPGGGNFTFYVDPRPDHPIVLAARAVGPDWQGPWLNTSFTFRDGAPILAPRAIVVQVGDAPGARHSSGLPWPAMLVAIAAVLRRYRQ